MNEQGMFQAMTADVDESVYFFSFGLGCFIYDTG